MLFFFTVKHFKSKVTQYPMPKSKNPIFDDEKIQKKNNKNKKKTVPPPQKKILLSDVVIKQGNLLVFMAML